MLCLQLTCPRSAAKIIASSGGAAEDGQAAAAPEMLSIVEEEARLWVAGCSEQERGWVPRRELESWLSLMFEVGVLRVPLVLDRAHGDMVTVSEGGALDCDEGQFPTALGRLVYRGEQGCDAVGS